MWTEEEGGGGISWMPYRRHIEKPPGEWFDAAKQKPLIPATKGRGNHGKVKCLVHGLTPYGERTCVLYFHRSGKKLQWRKRRKVYKVCWWKYAGEEIGEDYREDHIQLYSFSKNQAPS